MTLRTTGRRKRLFPWLCDVQFSNIWRIATILLLFYLSLIHWYSYISHRSHKWKRICWSLRNYFIWESKSFSDSSWEDNIYWTSVFIKIHKSIDLNTWSRIIQYHVSSTMKYSDRTDSSIVECSILSILILLSSLNYILFKDVKPLNDSCVELHHWSPYLYYKLGVNWYQMNNTLIQSELIGLNTDSIKPSWCWWVLYAYQSRNESNRCS